MTERKSRPPKARSERPSTEVGTELKAKRDAFVHTFFKKGAELAEELLEENDRLRRQILRLEEENAALRTQLASDAAMRDLLTKIEHLEREKQKLLSHLESQQASSTRFSNRFAELEEELSNLASLYVASYQLHSTLDLGLVVKHLIELLGQLVGSRSHAIFVADAARANLLPIAWEGTGGEPKALPVGAEPSAGDTAATLAERVFLTGVPHYAEGELAAAPKEVPAACVPMNADGKVLGVIVVYALLEQKPQLVGVDLELFKLLGAHAATALVGAFSFGRADETLPSAEALKSAFSWPHSL
jgi:hypothetical protein